MASVSLRNIKKTFDTHEVIHGMDCEIRDGEFIVLLGPSGCGKSTVLRMIAGLETITSGQIAIDGRVVNHLEPADRDIAMVFQNYALYPHMNVYNNIAYGLKIRGMAKTEIDKRVQRTAQTLELTPFLDRKPRQLSGGQRQRVAMGRCIVREPRVFLFDEPLSNLDAKLRVQMRLELGRLHEKLGVTSIYVTHDQVEAMTLADRLVVMNNGYTEQVGSPLEVYETPQTRFVAGFIGSPAMNFFHGRVSEDGASVAVSKDGKLKVPGETKVAHADREVVLGVRPEHLTVFQCKTNGLQMRVDHVEMLGADTIVHGALPEEAVEICMRIPDIHRFDKNDILFLSVDENRLHFFDPSSGKRI